MRLNSTGSPAKLLGLRSLMRLRSITHSISSKIARVRVLTAFSLLAFGNAAWALTVTPTTPTHGNYTVNADVVLGCTDFYWDEWGYTSRQCYQLEERNNGLGEYGGEGWRVAATSGSSVNFLNRALGTYEYRVFSITYLTPPWGGDPTLSTQVISEISVAVGGEGYGPKPSIFAYASPIGPASSPLYYFLTWNAIGASQNSCNYRVQKRTKLKVLPFYIYYWESWSASLPASGGVNIGKAYAWELRCTNPYGTSTIGGLGVTGA
jgi:hypothetical protein